VFADTRLRRRRQLFAGSGSGRGRRHDHTHLLPSNPVRDEAAIVQSDGTINWSLRENDVPKNGGRCAWRLLKTTRPLKAAVG